MKIKRRESLKMPGWPLERCSFGTCRSPSQSLVRETFLFLPDPKTAGFEHIVVVTMENRSFDHFSWLATQR